MLRTASLALVVVICGSSLAVGQEWADKMFKIRRHDFGTVARNSKQVFSFELQNIYKEPIHITGVRAELRLHDAEHHQANARHLGNRRRCREVQY